jgi:endonuclease/exonuclease/phosphatase family metal-dependent hydrolase
VDTNSITLITLNIWGGHVQKPLFDFIRCNRAVDIFCLQEVYHQAPAKITDEARYINLDVFAGIQRELPNHQGFFRPVVNSIYGIGMFIKNTLSVIKEGDIFIHTNDAYPGIGPTHSRNMQYAECLSHSGSQFTVHAPLLLEFSCLR